METNVSIRPMLRGMWTYFLANRDVAGTYFIVAGDAASGAKSVLHAKDRLGAGS